MTSHAERTGPSPAAKRRMNRVLLCLIDNGSLTVSEIKRKLSEPMSRADADSAIRRLLGAQQILRVPGSAPAKWETTTRGRDMAVRLVERGERY